MPKKSIGRSTAEARRADPPCSQAALRVTIVILTRNRRVEVTRTLEHILTDDPGLRVIVVDNASADGTAECLASRFPRVDVIRLFENAGAAARNAGVRRATTPYVALCDDDTWWAPGALARAAACFDTYPHLAILTGRIIVGTDEREDPACGMMARSPLPPDPAVPGVPVLGFMAGACMVRRSAFLAAGGFEPRFFIGGEEQLLAADLCAAGWGLAYVDNVIVHHHPSARRDAPGRRRLLWRNAIWFAWMRRPVTRALIASLSAMRDAAADPLLSSALVETMAGLVWALRRRRRLPDRVEYLLRLLEHTREKV